MIHCRSLARLAGATALALSVTGLSLAPAFAADAPAEIKFGTLYASAGRYASISMPVHYGLKLWIDSKNAEGGVYVKAFDKKIPIKLVAYDDQSNTATAATLYDQLITQDKVDVLIADSGSVLTSVAVPIARDRKMMLIDQTGTGATFFTAGQPLHRPHGRSCLYGLAESRSRTGSARTSGRSSASSAWRSSTRQTSLRARRRIR